MVTEVLRPSTLDEALALGARPGAAYLGGGTWLNSGRAAGVDILVSLENLGLGRVERRGDALVIGAAVTFQEVREAADAPPAVRAAVSFTASRTLRNMVTVGGELGLLPEDSVLVPVLIALEAEIHLAGAAALTVEELHRRRPGGLITGVVVPDGRRCAVTRLARTTHSPRSLVIAVSLPPSGHGHGRHAPRIVASDCTGLVAVVQRPEELAAAFVPRAGIHASARYKSYMAGLLAADLLASLGSAGERP
jgi:putative selenate reductase FAD-binding subunit